MKFTINNILFSLLIFILGCSDYQINKVVERAPDISVYPENHDSGYLLAGQEISEFSITVSNVGNEKLEIADIYLDNVYSNFEILSETQLTIEPAGFTEILLRYQPKTFETNNTVIKIISNDPDERLVEILINGAGDAPIIYITPDYFSFDDLYIGCKELLDIKISNIGNIDLVIDDIEFFTSVPDDFLIEDYSNIVDMLPITIIPSDEVDISINYVPYDLLDDSAYIEISSNDPVNPSAYADQDGTGIHEKVITEIFEQTDTVDVDILFIIDNSGSMSSNQTNLKNNFDSFINNFATAGVSYQLGIITTDDPNFVGPIINSSTIDPVTEFNNQIDTIGNRGNPVEKGLFNAFQSTTTGDASSASGFLRTAARLVVVYVSDERDHSSTSSSMTPFDYANSLKSLKSSTDLIVAHAIAGDYPSGCSLNGSAEFGDGYYDVVSELSGTFMSICAADWSITMDTLATESIASLRYELVEKALESSIQVKVDGIIFTDWYFEETLNTVIFNTTAPEGSVIEIVYGVLSCQ
tara:strand:+ start:2338 stop:3915 length:1578 start_codon:yes stop_codon:yes gene_type:complete